MNVFHLMQRPGSAAIKALGGLHRMFHWPHPIVTDSGGFQVYSLIHQNPKYGTLTERGMFFRPDGSSRRFLLTPEKSIQLQVQYGADVAICLDDCTDVDQSLSLQEESVARTVQWAKRCKAEFDRRVQACDSTSCVRPLIFAVIQGGGERGLRRRCAEELLAIGFDGYGLGGWPLDRKGNLLEDIIAYTRELVPASYPMHALGVGKPDNIVVCARMGYALFDSTMPTRDARHGRLCAFNEDPSRSTLQDGWYHYLYIQDSQYMRADQPVSENCDCLCCTNYSLAYLHHLYRVNDSLFYRLATLHNLRFTMQLMTRLQSLLS